MEAEAPKFNACTSGVEGRPPIKTPVELPRAYTNASEHDGLTITSWFGSGEVISDGSPLGRDMIYTPDELASRT
jgi:hypothetical protein